MFIFIHLRIFDFDNIISNCIKPCFGVSWYFFVVNSSYQRKIHFGNNIINFIGTASELIFAQSSDSDKAFLPYIFAKNTFTVTNIHYPTTLFIKTKSKQKISREKYIPLLIIIIIYLTKVNIQQQKNDFLSENYSNNVSVPALL